MVASSRRFPFIAALCLALASVVTAVSVFAIVRDPNGFFDMRILFGVIEGWWDGQATLYPSVEEQQRLPGFPSYRYPPLWAVTMLPLIKLLGLQGAIGAWSVLSLAVFGGGLALAMREVGLRWTRPAGAALLLLLALFGPLYETFYGPTKELLMVGLMAIAFVLGERRRPGLAGLAFAGAVLLKVYPVVFGVVFVLRRQWRLIAWAAAWFIVLNLAPLPLIGVKDTVQFYFEILPFAGGSSADPENAGIELLLMAPGWLRWFHHGLEPLEPTAFNAGLAAAWRALVLVGYAVPVVLAGRRGALTSPTARFLVFAGWAAAMLVLIPVAWVNYQVWLVLPLIALAARLHERPRGAPLRVLAAAVLLLAALGMSLPVKALLLARYAGPGVERPLTLSSALGKELEPELLRRVEERQRRLAELPDLEALRALDPDAVHERLRDRGVPDGGSVAADRGEVLGVVSLLERGADTRADRTLLLRARARLRAAGLSTRAIVGWMMLRPALGLLAFVAVMVGCVGLLVEDHIRSGVAR